MLRTGSQDEKVGYVHGEHLEETGSSPCGTAKVVSEVPVRASGKESVGCHWTARERLEGCPGGVVELRVVHMEQLNQGVPMWGS